MPRTASCRWVDTRLQHDEDLPGLMLGVADHSVHEVLSGLKGFGVILMLLG